MLMLEGRWCTSEGMLPPFMCSIWEVTTLVLVKLILVCEMHSGYFILFCLLCYLHGLKHHLHTTTCGIDKVGQGRQWVARWAFSWRQYWVSDRIIVWRLLVWLVQAAALQSWHVPQITAESEMRSTWRKLVCCALFHAWSSTLMHCGAPNTFVELRVHATEIECACYNFLCAGFSDVWAHMCMDNKMDPNRWHTYRKNIYIVHDILYIVLCVLYMYVCLFMFFYMCIACIAVCIYTHTALMDLRRSELRQQEAAEALWLHDRNTNKKQMNIK